MRVIFVNRYFFPDHSATSQLLSDLAFDLAERGIEIEVVTSRQLYGNAGADLAKQELIRGVRVTRLSGPTFGRGRLLGRLVDYVGFLLKAAWQVAHIAKREDRVVAMTDPPLLGVFLGASVRLRRARLINWFQDVFPEVALRLGYRVPRILSATLVGLRNRSMRGAFGNVAIGVVMAKFLENQSGRQCQVVPNWGLEELPTQDAHAEGSSLKAQWGLESKIVVGYSGNMGRAHKLEVLLQTAKLLEHQTSIFFLMIGDGAQRSSLEELAATLGLKNVVFKDYQPREMLRETLQVADIHFASLERQLEGLIVPSKVVGVLALGKPVLWVGDCDGEVGREIRESGCGISISDADPHQLADAIAVLARNPEQLVAMQVAARKLWRRKFTRRQSLDSWYALLSA